MEIITEALIGTLDKSFKLDLKDYFSRHPNEPHFSIFSDYCIGDKNKFNDVLTFTIAPTWVISERMIDLISANLKEDIKHIKIVPQNAIDVLKNKTFFHVSFIVKDLSGLLFHRDYTEKEVAIKSAESIIDMIASWIPNQPKGKDKFLEQIKRVKRVKQELAKKNANIKLFKWISLNAFFASVIASYITSLNISKTKTITWFSDRDNMVSAYSSILYDLFEINHFGICLKTMEPFNIPRIGIGVYEENSKNLWYDSLIRIPDYISGAIASWNLDINLTSREKHAKIIEEVVASNRYLFFGEAIIGRESYKFGRHNISKASGGEK